jgi:hypothetical protein
MPPKKRMTIRNGASKRRKAEGEQFRRRRINFGKKGQDMVDMCGVKLYVVMERHGHFWEYNSEPHNGMWPPSRQELAVKHQRNDKHIERQGRRDFQRHHRQRRVGSPKAANTPESLAEAIEVQVKDRSPKRSTANKKAARCAENVTKIEELLAFFHPSQG